MSFKYYGILFYIFWGITNDTTLADIKQSIFTIKEKRKKLIDQLAPIFKMSKKLTEQPPINHEQLTPYVIDLVKDIFTVIAQLFKGGPFSCFVALGYFER